MLSPADAAGVSEPLVGEPDAPLYRVPEAAIHDAWARLLFDQTRLRTTTGEPVTVVDPGTLNRGSGPDFSNASVRIGSSTDELLWIGDVEIHRSSSEWNQHRHQHDPAYKRVMLHVVLSPDFATGQLERSDGTVLPELVLLPYLNTSLRALIHDFYATPQPALPYCSHRWTEVTEDSRRDIIRQHGRERLVARARRLAQEFGHAPDLDKMLVRGIFRALGYAPNSDAMERLSSRLPLALLRRTEDPLDIQACLIGLAGLADARLFGDDLSARYDALCTAHALPAALAPEAWRQGGRPANAPRQRLAQAAAMLSESPNGKGLLRDEPLATLRAALVRPDPTSALRALLRDAVVPGVRGLGAHRADVVLLNAVLPVLLLDAEVREDHALEAQILKVFSSLPPEEDRVTRAFEEAGLAPTSAMESQGIHHLAASLCTEGRCARCKIGQTLYPALRSL